MAGIVGIDIGGTFTDVVYVDDEVGTVIVEKVPTASGDKLEESIADALARLRDERRIALEGIRTVVHGTTIATNAVLQRTLPRTGLVVTQGFGDVLEIGPMLRADAYDLDARRPRPFVARADVIEVAERVDRDGRVVIELTDAEAERVAKEVAERGIQAVAICLLFSFTNRSHEDRLAAAIAKRAGDVAVVASVDADPEPREFLRANTTALSASLSPLVTGYIERVGAILRRLPVPPELLIMQSGGGLMPPEEVAANSHRMVLSGPAGGVIAAERSATGRYANLITIDVGGTSSDLCLIVDGRAVVQVDPSPLDLSPVRASALGITALGAGGGSVATVDEVGVLRVGPRSAGSVPGPVCYGLGGAAPTVTDAQAVLGRLSPLGLLGGEIPLDIEAARALIEAEIARPLGLGWDEAALAIVDVAVAAMDRGLRAVSVDSGRNPSDFSLFAYGGGGPLHACDLARMSGIATVLVPGGSSAFSAMGLLMADLRRTYSHARPHLAANTTAAQISSIFAGLQRDCDADHRDGRTRATVFERFADLRYVGQRGTIRLPLPDWPPGDDVGSDLVAAFRRRHRQEYGHASATNPIEIAALRLVRVQSWYDGVPLARQLAPQRGSSRRQVYFAETGWVECPVLDRSSIRLGETVDGPAVLEDRESTTILPHGCRGRLEGDCLVIEVRC